MDVSVFPSWQPWVATPRSANQRRWEMLWLLVLLLVLFAVAGGVAVSKFIFLLLIVAVVLALLGAFNRSTT